MQNLGLINDETQILSDFRNFPDPSQWYAAANAYE